MVSLHCPLLPDTRGMISLGIGDQGAGGMGIPIGKLSLYSLVGGIRPERTLPIMLDVGTNNQERLRDPEYVGWRHERVTGQAYHDFIEQFVQAIRLKLPSSCLLQWEDFATPHARPILRDQLLTFNDDIQGTAGVTLGAVLGAVEAARQAAARPADRFSRRRLSRRWCRRLFAGGPDTEWTLGGGGA